jgi:hypothetical protein
MKTRLKSEENTGFWQIPRASGILLPMVVSKFFPEKTTPRPAFQRLYLNFSYQISVLCPKNPNILPFCTEIFHPKK